MMAMIRDDLALLNVHHDVFFSERTLHADGARAIRTAITDLTLKGHIYKGKLPPPKGEKPDDWEDREQTLFRSTAVGDDMDRPLVKSDGSFTYFAADVAYLKDKVDRGFDQLIYVLGADHGGYVKRLEALARAVTDGRVEADRHAVPTGQALPRWRAGPHVEALRRVRHAARGGGGGRPRPDPLHDALPQERRAARFRLRQGDGAVEGQPGLLRPVCVGALPFRVPAGARTVCRTWGSSVAALADNVALLTDESEIALIRKLAEYPRVIESCAQQLEPHRLAFYLYDLASSFHGQWNRGADNHDLRFVKVNDPELTNARLGLVQAVSDVLTSGLALIGAEAPREMR